jgi:integrase
MGHLTGKLTKRGVDTAKPGRHGDGGGLYLVVDPSEARRWMLRVTVKRKRCDYGLGGASYVSIQEAREQAQEIRRIARQGGDPRFDAKKDIPTFEEMAKQVHKDRLRTWKNTKHVNQWINTLRDYAFPKIGRLPVSDIGQPQVLLCLSPIWTEKHETARRLSQRIKIVLDVAKSKGFRSGENPVTEIHNASVLPKGRPKVEHHKAMAWRDVPAFHTNLQMRSAMAAKALMFTILTASRTNEVLEAKWDEINFEDRLWTVPAERMKTGEEHRVPLTDAMLAILEPLQAMQSEYVFEGQKRNKPLSNMSMLMLLRRMGLTDVTVHGFRSTFRDWAREVANAPREVAEKCLAHKVGNDSERSYARSDLLDHRRVLMDRWSAYITGEMDNVVSIREIS